MPRPRSDDKRQAILEAATRTIVKQGLSTPTAGIAKEAGVANGSLFTYFDTKTELFNQLYLHLKFDMAEAAMRDVRESDELRRQVQQMWQNWMGWALAAPEKRRALAQLSVSDEITPETRATGHKTMQHLADLIGRVRQAGSMRKVSPTFVLALMNSVAESTMDFTAADRANAKTHSKDGFEALWRMMG